MILIAIKFGEFLLRVSQRIVNGLRSYAINRKSVSSGKHLKKFQNFTVPRFFNPFLTLTRV